MNEIAAVRVLMRRFSTVVAFMVACASASMAHGQVFKCKDASGKVAYQSAPCAAEQQESRPVILKGATLTEEEKFNAAAYASGTTPEAARRMLQGGATTPNSSAAGADAQDPTPQRAIDCNRRYDKLADDLRSKYGPKGQGNLSRHLVDVERDRSACIYGQAAGGGGRSSTVGLPSGPATVSADRGARLGQCQGSCASEQGICIGSCQGNGVCISRCTASHGRCVAGCQAY
jgi:hypothetical protein